MTLNYGKTFLLGFGFFGVSVIWGIYNAFVPIFLAERFNLAPALIGVKPCRQHIANRKTHRSFCGQRDSRDSDAGGRGWQGRLRVVGRLRGGRRPRG